MNRLIIILIILFNAVTFGQDQAGIKQAQCDNALHACLDLTEAQDQEIILLKTHITKLDEELADSTSIISVPNAVWALAGAILGGIVVHEVTR